MRTKDSGAVSVRLRFDEQTRLGPGKIALLEGVARFGSIAAAARDMGMSDRRAWLLIDSVNTMFRSPVVVDTGGPRSGDAALTDLGQRLIRAYRAIERDTIASVRSHLEPLAEDFVTVPRLDAGPDTGADTNTGANTETDTGGSTGAALRARPESAARED